MAKGKKLNKNGENVLASDDKPLTKKSPSATPPTTDAPAPKLILLEGRVPRTLSFQLEHDHFCKELGQCRCGTAKVGVVKKSKVDGSESPVFKNRRVYATIDVRFRRKTQVEEAALKVPAIAAAVARRIIRVHR
jgi:hypothetical protein